jgi:hypothetical protein
MAGSFNPEPENLLNNKNKIIEETYDDVESDDGQRRTATRF